jgi:hypothetical protein
LAIGIVGIGIAIFKRNQSRGSRIGTAVAGVFLLIVGFVYAGITVVSVLNGVQTVTVLLNTKTVAVDNCGDNGQTCTRYVLETSNRTASYDFNVPQAVYQRAQVNTCYNVSYYMSKSPFNVTADTSSYHQVSAVARIEEADAAACQ